MRFRYSISHPFQNEFDSLPRLQLLLYRNDGRTIEALGLVDSGATINVLSAFDPRRVAILLLGGNKGGDNRWYEDNVAKADMLYEKHLEELKTEGFL